MKHKVGGAASNVICGLLTLGILSFGVTVQLVEALVLA